MWCDVLQLGSRTTPTVLNEVDLPIISNEECEEWFRDGGDHERIPNIMLCAGYKDGGKDTCDVGSKITTYFFKR